jgi:hypothetical protein
MTKHPTIEHELVYITNQLNGQQIVVATQITRNESSILVKSSDSDRNMSATEEIQAILQP